MMVGGYGQMRATDADRDSVHNVLQAAYADGRLTWDEFETRSAGLMEAKTYDELGAFTRDLSVPVPYRPGSQPLARRTNGMAVGSMVCGLCQVPFWFLAGIPAIVLGHAARRQIRETGEAGAGMALAGLIMGYLGVFVLLMAIVAFFALAAG
jgi:hypothetical protein